MRGIFYIVTKDGDIIFKPEFMISDLNVQALKNEVESYMSSGLHCGVVYREVRSDLFSNSFEHTEVVVRRNTDDWHSSYAEDSYHLTDSKPTWWSEEHDKKSDAFLNRVLQKYVIDNAKIQSNYPINAYVVYNSNIDSLYMGSRVNYLYNSKIMHMNSNSYIGTAINSTIQDMKDVSRIETVGGTSVVMNMYDRSGIGVVCDSAGIVNMRDFSHADHLTESSSISTMSGDSSLKTMEGRSEVLSMLDHSKVKRMYDWSYVKLLDGYSSIDYMADNSRVDEVALSDAYIAEVRNNVVIQKYMGSRVPIGFGIVEENSEALSIEVHAEFERININNVSV